MHKGQDQVTFVEVYPGIALFFSRLYILLYIHMQNLLNWADRASTVPNRRSNEFSGKNLGFTGSNHDNTCHNLTTPFTWGTLTQRLTITSCIYFPRRCFFCGSFLLVMLHVGVCCNVVSDLCSLVVTCLERADLLAIVCVCVLCFVTFPVVSWFALELGVGLAP